jgi:hypothetical protein
MKNRPTAMRLLGQPLFRLLAINLALGTATAVLMLGGLLALNPHGLRDLIFSDRSPGVALGLLLFGLVITFGSVVMGSAIMAIGCDGHGGGRRTSARTNDARNGGGREARAFSVRRPQRSTDDLRQRAPVVHHA